MSLRRKVLQGSGLMMGGQMLGLGMSFIRNIIVARLISTDDFGIASTFFISISLFEMISNLSVDRLLVQAEDGDGPEFQATAQAFQALRGAANSLLMFLLAWPFSRLFDIPQALWAFQCVALVPLIRGFVHLDPKRLHREMRFGRDVLSELLPQAVALALAWPLAKWFGNYAAVLWLLVAQAAAMVLVSHITAVRRYAWAWNRALFTRMARFGWPLLLNGLLMFLIRQGTESWSEAPRHDPVGPLFRCDDGNIASDRTAHQGKFFRVPASVSSGTNQYWSFCRTLCDGGASPEPRRNHVCGTLHHSWSGNRRTTLWQSLCGRGPPYRVVCGDADAAPRSRRPDNRRARVRRYRRLPAGQSGPCSLLSRPCLSCLFGPASREVRGCRVHR